MADKEYTADEVAQHTGDKDVWMSIHGKVYDVTPFLEDHPGGPEILRNVAGMDASEQFDEVFHSDKAKDMMHKYEIGKLKDYQPSDAQKAAKSTQVTGTRKGSGMLLYAVPVLIILLAVLFKALLSK
jgi:cytochrome b involved in lipid metabolism